MGREYEGDAHSLNMYSKQKPFYALFLSKTRTDATFEYRSFELKILLYKITEIVGRH